MDSLNRIFNSINEAKKVKKKKNRYDSGSFGMKAESRRLSPKQERLAALAGKPDEIDAADLAEVRRRGKKKKVNASTEIIQVLDLLKEAYQDELISEEAFLAIADPIMRSLMEGRSVTFPDTFEMEGLDGAEEEDANAKDANAKDKKPSPPKKPQPPKNRKRARGSFHRRIRRPRG
jgi:hypothetical protein